MNQEREKLDLSFSSQNCNSLNMSSMKNQDMKINAIVEYKTDIVFLSDVRLNLLVPRNLSFEFFAEIFYRGVFWAH